MVRRLLYQTALWLALPWVLLRLFWRGWRQRGYWLHVGERFGFFRHAGERPVLWLHAVSVGETRAAASVLALLQQRYPQYQILLTHGTPTGRATGAQLYGATVWQAWLPYDLAFAVRRFVRHYRPALGLVMETEIWPNLLRACAEHRVPVMLINARLSARSAARYRYLGSVMREALSGLCSVAAQSEADAQRLRELGARHLLVMGNLKFDIHPPEAQWQQARSWRAGLGSRLVCLAASTREGEEALVLDAWQRLSTNALLVIVPRHPQRFDAVAQLVSQRGLRLQRRSDGSPVAAQTEVWLGDSMGELFAFYGLADVAVIGGSLLPFGGQNLIEAAAMGCPLVLGSYRWNFTEASHLALACGAAVEVTDGLQLTERLRELLVDAALRAAMRDAALRFSREHQGATLRLLPEIERCLQHGQSKSMAE